jgi:DNA mismatch repair protein MutS
MAYHSILAPQRLNRAREAPDFFGDLNLDQVVAAVIAGREQYDLASYFYSPLPTAADVIYRHEVVQDLERPGLRAKVYAFATQMALVRESLQTASKLHYKYQKEAWFRDAVELYRAAVAQLANDLANEELDSRGFVALGTFISQYVNSDVFATLAGEARDLADALAAIKYRIHIRGGVVAATKYESDPDYSVEVAAAFERFKQADAEQRLFNFSDPVEMDNIEARTLGLVAQLYPETFAALSAFCIRHRDFLNGTVVAFDREVQFYLAYLEHADRLRQVGLPFTLPVVSETNKEERSTGSFDLALATKLFAEKKTVVTNDFYLTGAERILVVSGPNQGGKTTFARMFGQLHYLARLGLPVPGTEAHLFLCDALFTHFEQVEDIAKHRGKLQDDLVRIHDILGKATSQSVVIMNEIFTSTTLEDALFLSKKVMARVRQLGSLGVCVTFLDELASSGPETVSMVSTIVPDKAEERTFKIVRRPADGLAYAMSIAKKYGLTFDRVRERIAS